MDQIRQGDLLLTNVRVSVVSHGELARLPAAGPLKRTDRGFQLLEGEGTGHAHCVADTPAISLSTRSGVLYLTVETETEVTHDEHAPVKVPPGKWAATRQREYDPEAADEDYRFVAD